MHLKRFGGRQTGSPAGGRPDRPAGLQNCSPDKRPGRLGTAEHPRSQSLYTPRNARAAALFCLSPTKPGPAQRSRSDSAPGRGKRPSSGRSRVSPGTRRNVGQGPLPPPDSPPRPAPFSAPLRLPASRPRRSGPSQRTAGLYGAGLPLAPRPAKGEPLLFPDYPKASSASKMSHSIFGPGASSLMPVPRLAAARRAALRCAVPCSKRPSATCARRCVPPLQARARREAPHCLQAALPAAAPAARRGCRGALCQPVAHNWERPFRTGRPLLSPVTEGRPSSLTLSWRGLSAGPAALLRIWPQAITHCCWLTHHPATWRKTGPGESMIALLASGHGSCVGSQLCCPQTLAAGPACGTWLKKQVFRPVPLQYFWDLSEC